MVSVLPSMDHTFPTLVDLNKEQAVLDQQVSRFIQMKLLWTNYHFASERFVARQPGTR